MKRYLTLAVFLLCVISATAQLSSVKDSKQPNLDKLRSTDKTLSDEQIAELLETHTDEKAGRDYKFTAGFGRLSLSVTRDKSKISKYKASGKVPYRLTAEFTEYKDYKGKKVGKRLSGTAKFYVLDEEGKLVDKGSSSLSTMCPG